MLSCPFIAALWSPAGKWLTTLLSFVMFNCVFVTFPCGILGQVWYLIVSISDLWQLSYFLSQDKISGLQISGLQEIYFLEPILSNESKLVFRTPPT